jgi:HD-like signal output (HDOD) protein
MTSVSAETARTDFAKKAAEHFAKNPKHYSFGEIERGEYLALRWGMGNDCVLVIRQHEDEQAVNFQQAITQVEP